VNCHFFKIRRGAGQSSGENAVGEEERGRARSGDFGWAPEGTQGSYNILGCHMGVWMGTDNPNQGKADRYEVIVETDRRGSCFFWPYHPHMRFEAAETLQKREYEAREAARDRRHTIWGLWIAGTGLVANAVVGIGQIIAASRTAPAGAINEKPPGSSLKAPLAPGSPAAPTSPPGDPRASAPADRTG
jgi:hypothetical protein